MESEHVDPRPVPSECMDTLPPSKWKLAWQLDPKGSMELPSVYWNNHWFKFRDDDKKRVMAKASKKKFKPLFPSGLYAKYDKKEDSGTNSWDNSKHGYWNIGGRLQYRGPNDTVRNGVDGADKWD
jgi:hypothetical protein